MVLKVYAHAGHQSADDIESIKVDYYYYDDDSEEENSDSFFERRNPGSGNPGDPFRFMMENQLFDVLGRKTKKAGGYMTYLPLYHAPFIFANFNGTSGDVDVITHECGHAFQGYLAAQDPIREHADIGMETAEIHSMSMEFFTEKWMNLFFGDRAQDYVEMHLEDAAAFIPYGCMVDESCDPDRVHCLCHYVFAMNAIPAVLSMEKAISDEVRRVLEQRFNLDKPVWEQFFYT